MKNYIFKVKHDEGDIRIDQYLASCFSSLVARGSSLVPVSRSHLKKLIDIGNVLVNDSPVKPHYRTKSGETIKICLDEPATEDALAENITLDILYEDEDIIVLNKPSNIAVHPGAGRYKGTLVNALLYHCKSLSTLNQARPGIVHRLDKDTSGVMIVAKNNASHAQLAGQFKERTIKKNYIALVQGIVELDEGAVDLPIGRHPTQRQKMAVRYDSEKNAVTEYKTLKRLNGFSVVLLNLKTGRTHQIRVHMAYLGHPVLGDAKYGAKCKSPNQAFLPSRQALHSYCMGFRHPTTGEPMEFKAPLPKDMRDIIGQDIVGII